MSWHGKAFCKTGPLWGESTSLWWSPLTRGQYFGVSIFTLLFAWISCWTNSQFVGDLVTDEFPSQRPVKRSFDIFFDLCLNKQLSKQSRRRWFETPLCSLWRHCNGPCTSWLPVGTSSTVNFRALAATQETTEHLQPPTLCEVQQTLHHFLNLEKMFWKYWVCS